MSRTPGKGTLVSELKSTKIPGRARISAVLFSATILDAFYGFKKDWFFYYSPPDRFQSEKYRLTWDGKCEKFGVLIQLFSRTPDFRWQGWSNGGKNQNPKKCLDQNLSPKKSRAEFSSHNKNFPESVKWYTQKTLHKTLCSRSAIDCFRFFFASGIVKTFGN